MIFSRIYRIHMDGIREYFLTGPTAINIRMVEEIRAFFQRCLDKSAQPQALSSELIRMQPTATTGTSKVLVPSFIVLTD